jgi:hypothetical protein
MRPSTFQLTVPPDPASQQTARPTGPLPRHRPAVAPDRQRREHGDDPD